MPLYSYGGKLLGNATNPYNCCCEDKPPAICPDPCLCTESTYTLSLAAFTSDPQCDFSIQRRWSWSAQGLVLSDTFIDCVWTHADITITMESRFCMPNCPDDCSGGWFAGTALCTVGVFCVAGYWTLQLFPDYSASAFSFKGPPGGNTCPPGSYEGGSSLA